VSRLITSALLFAIFAVSGLAQNNCKLRLADQEDPVNKRGFVLALEATEANTAQPCRLSSVRLTLTIGDGLQFQQLVDQNTVWQQDISYRVRAVIQAAPLGQVRDVQLFRINQDNSLTLLTNRTLPFTPASNAIPMSMNKVTASEGGVTELFWYNTATSATSGGSTFSRFMPDVALQQYERLRETRGSFTADATVVTTIDANFAFANKPDLATFAPYVDKYGQSKHANYNKVAVDGDFTARNQAEQAQLTTWLAQVNTDVYGAPTTVPWTDTATGYYRVKKINNYWWLLTPEGKPTFYIGLDHLPATYEPLPAGTLTTGRVNYFEQLPAPLFREPNTDRVFFYNQNLGTKYGASGEISSWVRALDRLRAWGFSGAGKFKATVPSVVAPSLNRFGATPEIVVLPIGNFQAIPPLPGAPSIDASQLIAFPDIFNPAVRNQLQTFISTVIGNRTVDPNVVGWSLGNEIHGIVTNTHVASILASGSQTDAKVNLINYAIDNIYSGSVSQTAQAWQVPQASIRSQLYVAFLNNIPPSDLQQMRQFFQKNLHRVYYETIKTVDPNHLYFGFWIVPNLWVTSDDWRSLAQYTDVIGYNHFIGTHVPSFYKDLSQTFDKPIFNGEFSFPPTYGGQRGYGTAYPTRAGVASYDEAEAGARYAQFLTALRADPSAIGGSYFMYVDQMITGRNFGDPFGFSNQPLVQGQQYAYGLVDITDTPKQTLVEAVRGANLAATAARLTLTGTPSANQFTVAVSVAGNGTVTGTLPCAAQCSQVFQSGTVITLNASPGTGAVFTGWSGDCTGIGTCVLTVTGNISVTAVFNASGGGGGGGGGVSSGPLHFQAISPCRLVDTRNPVGPLGGPSLGAINTRSFPLLTGPCGLPNNAVSYSLNITVVPKVTLGYITVFPTGQAQPLVSTLNSLDGRIKANAAIVPAGSNGEISVFATNETDIIIDVNGVFVPVGSTAFGQSFYPVTPCRIADTRNPAGAFGAPALVAQTTRAFPILSAGCGVPFGATAYSLNITVIPSKPLGYLTIWPFGLPQPVVSTLNALTGTIVANAAIVPAGNSGAINVYSTDGTELLIDINGYFAPSGGLNALNFHTLTPCRIADTRNANGPLGGPAHAAVTTRDYPVQLSNCTVPSTARAYSMNSTVLPATLLGYMTMWPSGTSQPVVSTLNALDGSITSNAALVPAGIGGSISVFMTHLTNLILDINGYFAP
jgi:hypothetical protein